MSISDSENNFNELQGKRNNMLQSLYYIENVIWSLYRIAYSVSLTILLFLFGVSVFLSLYNNSFILTGLLADVANAINTLKLESIILILVLAFIHVVSNFINSYFKKE